MIGIHSYVKELGFKLQLLCPHCHTENLSMECEIRYFQIRFIPFFPVGNYKKIICGNCKNERNQDDFTSEEMEVLNKDIVKKEFKTPWWTFIGLVIALFGFLAPIFNIK